MKNEEISNVIKQIEVLGDEITGKGEKINDINKYIDTIYYENKLFFDDTMKWMQAADKDSVRCPIPSFKLDPNRFEETNAIGQKAVTEFGDILKDGVKLAQEVKIYLDDYNALFDKFSEFIKSLGKLVENHSNIYSVSESIEDKLSNRLKRFNHYKSEINKFFVIAEKFEARSRALKNRIIVLRGLD